VRGGTIDARSDVFSLGIVMWEALTGLRLFFHPNDLDTMRNVLHRPVPKPSELRAGIAPAIDAIILKALEREPEHRYQDAAAMAADLEEHLREARFSPESLVALLGELFAGEDDARELRLPEGPGPGGRITSNSRPTMGTVSTSSLPPPIADNSDPAENYATVSSIKRLSDIAAQHRRRRMLQLSALGGAAVGAAAIFVMTVLRGPNERAPLPRVIATAESRASVSPVPETSRKKGRAAAKPVAKPLPVIEATPGEKPSGEPAPRPVVAPATNAAMPAPVVRVAAPVPTEAAAKVDNNVGAPGPIFPEAEDEASRSPKVAPAVAAAQTRAQKALSSGLVALKKGEYLQAAARLEEAATANPHSPEALVGLAEAEFELARYGQAANHARKAAAMAPKNLRSRSVLGDALFKLGRFREAAQVYVSAQALSPNDTSLKERRQRAEAMIGSPAEAPRE
ncbi:MAG TPA: tetratricopeptide repeat protein, partial [Polyangia bacterium]